MAVFPLSFQDAGFEHTFARCRSQLEGPSTRWMPFGMPRLNPAFRDCVFFLYGRHPGTGAIEGPIGTGVVVGKCGNSPEQIWNSYAVTSAHVVRTGASIIRINLRGGGSRFIELELHEWEFIPGGCDLAAVDITERLDSVLDEVMLIPTSMFVSGSFIARHYITVGEDGFMLGLFASLPGENRNAIAARFGNLALLADDELRIRQPNGTEGPCHIFDMHSRPGFSGSPVFIYRTPGADLRHVNTAASTKAALREHPGQMGEHFPTERSIDAFFEFDAEQNQFLNLLGIHLDQYREPVRLRKRRTGENADPLTEGDSVDIPGSMTIVAPAWEIEKLLNKEVFVKMRDARDQALTELMTAKGQPFPGGGESAS
jgi:hypothetical protein